MYQWGKTVLFAQFSQISFLFHLLMWLIFSEAVDLETTKIMLDFGVICFWIFVN